VLRAPHHVQKQVDDKPLFPNQQPTPSTGKARPKPWERNLSERNATQTQQQPGVQPASQEVSAAADSPSCGNSVSSDTKVSFDTENIGQHRVSPAAGDESMLQARMPHPTPWANGSSAANQGLQEIASENGKDASAAGHVAQTSSERNLSAAEKMEQLADALVDEEAAQDVQEGAAVADASQS
jgi:hypothetical protein